MTESNIKKYLNNPVSVTAFAVTLIVAAFIIASFFLAYPEIFYCTVTFETDHGAPVDPIDVRYGSSLAELPSTERKYNTFGGWYYDKEYTKPYNGEKIKRDTSLFARWDTIFDADYFRAMQTKLAEAYADEFALYLYESNGKDSLITKALDIDPLSPIDFKVYSIGGNDSTGREVTLLLAFVFDTFEDADNFYQENIENSTEEYLFLGDVEYFRVDVLQGGVAIGNADMVLGEIYEDEDFYYAVNEEKTEASVLRYKNDAEGVEVPATYNGLPITALGAYSFYNKSLTSVAVNQNIKEIGYFSFAFCGNLADLDIPAGIEQLGNGFVACSSGIDIHLAPHPYFKLEGGALYDTDMGRLIAYIGSDCETFEVPEGIGIIGEYAFAYRSTLGNVIFPEGLAYILDYAFAESGIEILQFPRSIIQIGIAAFKGKEDGTSALRAVDFGEDSSLETLSMKAFADNPMLQSFVFTKSIRSTDNGILKNCTGLKKVEFEQGTQIDTLYDDVFYNCANLQEISLPDSVLVLLASFTGCTSLKYVNLNKVSNFVPEAFATCPALETVVFDTSSGLTDIFAKTFYNCVNLKQIELPDTLTSIGTEAFANCTSLQSIDIKNTKYISNDAFAGCVNLAAIDLKRVESIGGNAFINCESLQSADLTGAKTVGGGAFTNCVSLSSVMFSDALVELGGDVLSGCPSIKKLALSPSTLIGGSPLGLGEGLEELILPIVKNDAGNYISVKQVFGFGLLPDSLITIRISNNITEIPASYFEVFDKVRQIIIPDTVQSIGEYAFRGCGGLAVFSVPSSLKEIGAFAFAACTSLSEFPLPAGLVSIGEHAFAGDSLLKEQKFPSSLKRLGAQAYLDCELFTAVTLPDGMEYVANGAFGGCYGIEQIRVPLAPYQIENQKFPNALRYYIDIFRSDFECNIKSVELTRDTEIVPERAFANLDSVETIVFPDTIQRFDDNSLNGLAKVKKLDISMAPEYGRQIFSDCPSLEELTVRLDSVYDKNTPSWFGYFFATEYGLCFPSEYESVKKITVRGDNTELAVKAFAGADKLEEVVLPSTLTCISERLFENCMGLKRITIPTSVSEISKYAFAGCSSLKKIDIPASVYFIGEGAFSNAASLETVNIPEGSALYSLGSGIFNNCISLKNIRFPDYTIWEIPYSMFNNCKSLTDFEMPSGLQYIRTGAFRNAGLTKVIVPYTVIEVDWYAFENCVNIEELVFEQIDVGEVKHSRLVEIGRGAFINCGLIEKIVLPSSLNSIVGEAFKNCVSLKEVVVLHEYNYLQDWSVNSTRLDHGGNEDGVFYNCHPDILFYVPVNNAGVDNGVEAYKVYVAGWKIYENKIRPIP